MGGYLIIMKNILITGSSGLIGKKIKNFLSKKFNVTAVDLKNGIDLSNENQVIQFFKKNNKFNFLINLHGANEHVMSKKSGNLVKKKISDENMFDHFFKNNVFSIYLTNKYFIKYCKKGKGIINFSSIYSIMSPKHTIYDEPKNIFYVSSKFAVNGITKYFATKYGKKVSVNTIANHGIEWKQPIRFKQKLVAHIPKSRMMKAKDLFGVIELLCRENNNYINGSTIIIDGGYSSW
jgi:NAD(P)-dependent dehydrogenase (short-subunit alcohol dehydrogenase family)